MTRAGRGVGTQAIEMCRLVLAGLNTSRPDDFAPLLSFVGYMISQVGRRERKWHPPQFHQLLSYLGISEGSIDFGIEPINDLLWGIFGSAQGLPPTRFIAWQEIAHWRDIRQNV